VDTKTILKAYVNLCKPRIGTLVLVTAAIGFALGSGPETALWKLPILLAGVVTVSSGASALNHFLEKDIDARMDRTKNRPIPSGIVPEHHALMFGVYMSMSGVLLLLLVNMLTAFLGLLTAYLYVLVYTPMKRVTWLNTPIGAVPGALPILGGWTAASGQIEWGGIALFAILWFWQHPHFYAIAWMYRDDYAKGGLKMLPVVSPDGASTFRQSVLFCMALLPISLSPVFLQISGPLYAMGAVVLGGLFLFSALRARRTRSTVDARKLMRASLLYLPALMVILVLDFSL